MSIEAFGYRGKRALVVGGATGIGAATAALVRDLGAEVTVMDHARVETAGVEGLVMDLRDGASIDAALEACGGPIHALFACAGVADGAPGIERINFIGHRHLLDRALAQDLLPRGAAVAMISSAAGMGWESEAEPLGEFLDTPDFDAAVAWIEAHPERANYMWSKQAICLYVARQAFPLLRRGIRINAILPGPTDTPLARANAQVWLGFGSDYREETGTETSTPEEQAHVLAFLCSDAASAINGTTVITDSGYASSGLTGSFPAATPVVEFLLGRL